MNFWDEVAAQPRTALFLLVAASVLIATSGCDNVHAWQWKRLHRAAKDAYNEGKYRGPYDIRLPMALEKAEEALRFAREVFPPDHPDIAESLSQLALVYHEYYDFNRAASLLQEALRIRQHKLSPDHPAVVTNLYMLAAMYYLTGDTEKGEELHRRATQFQLKEQSSDPYTEWKPHPTGLNPFIPTFSSSTLYDNIRTVAMYSKDKPVDYLQAGLQNLQLAYAGSGRPHHKLRLLRREAGITEEYFPFRESKFAVMKKLLETYESMVSKLYSVEGLDPKSSDYQNRVAVNDRVGMLRADMNTLQKRLLEFEERR